MLHQELNDGICTVYVDDLIVHTDGDFQKHISDVRRVFTKIRNAGMRAKPTKVEIGQTKIEFLGYVIDRAGIHVNPERVGRVKDYPAPKTLKALKRSLGMTSYVRRFIEDYAQKAQPLTDLTREYVGFTWDDDKQQAFVKLKNALIAAPVLALPNFDKPFRLYADASNNALGATLMQDAGEGLRPIAYASKTLSDVERRWQTSEKEAFALYWATKKFEDYLKGA